MNYSKIQKIISFIVLFSFFFTSVFSFPNLRLFSKTSAASGDFYKLVSILVEEDIYSDVKENIERYAKDIQGVLENTRVVILPVPKSATSFQVASLNEGLYFDGYKSLDNDVSFNSKLIGTILVGNLQIPIINNLDGTTLSIAPYVDFEDKTYIFNHKTGKFEKNLYAKENFKPEIWHGVIFPNAGTKEENIEQINDFFDKDHDFYVGENLFKKSSRVLNGNKNEKLDKDYTPFVFYYDQFREEKSIHYPNYIAYLAYLKNKEDIVYNRYSKDLVNNILKDIKDAEEKEIGSVLEEVGSEKIKNVFKNIKGSDADAASNSPDIMKIPIVKKSIKKFLEIFNKGTISDFRTNVHNAGRYNKKGSKVNMDFIPYLVSILDNTTDKLLKSTNYDLENYIFWKLYPEMVHVPIPVSIYAGEGLPKNIGAGTAPVSGESVSGDEGGGEDACDGYCVPGQDNDSTDSKVILRKWECSTEDPNSLGQMAEHKCFPYEGDGTTVIHSVKFNGIERDSLVVVNGIQVQKYVFAHILDIKGFYADAYGNAEFQLNDGTNIQIKIPVLRKILEAYESKYDNFYYGRAAEYLGGPEGGTPGLPKYCSIYRGSKDNSGQVVEANHGFNYRVSKKDQNNIMEKISWSGDYGDENVCLFPRKMAHEYVDINEFTRGYWGGNSIINIDKNDGLKILLKNNIHEDAIVDLFDPRGAQKVDDKEGDSIKDCYNYNYILTYKPVNNDDWRQQAIKQGWGDLLKNVEFYFKNTYRTPFILSENEPITSSPTPIRWDCLTKNQHFKPETEQTEFGRIYVISDLMRRLCKKQEGSNIALNCEGDGDVEYTGDDGVNSAEDCLVNGIELRYTPMGGPNRKLDRVSTYIDHEGNEVYCPVTRYKYHFTSTEGYIKHHSPTKDELDIHLKTPGIPNLPIDRDRYLEVFTGDFLKFKYPYLFRAKIDKDKLKDIEYKKDENINEENSLYFMDVAKKTLEKFLEEYDNSTGNALEVKNYVTSKEKYTLKIGDEEKDVNYFDILSFAIFWNSLDSVSSKYRFVVENYLSDQLGGNDYKFLLPKNKGEYEIAYLGAMGDAKNMYFKLDPSEKKSENPYTNIIQKNNSLSSNIFSFQALSSSNQIASSSNSDSKSDFGNGNFECSPPEGVPIRKWLPAVKCRLKSMLPPKIGISENNCGKSLFNKGDFIQNEGLSDIIYDDSSSGDTSKNSDFSINSNGSVCLDDFNKNGLNDCLEKELENVNIDFYSDANRYYFGNNGKLSVIVKNSNGKRVYIDNNSKIYFSLEKIVDLDSGEIINDKDSFNNYINFKDIGIKTKNGKAIYNFTVKSKNADIFFKATLKLQNTLNHEEQNIIESGLLKVEVRNEKLFLTSSNNLNGELNLGGDYAVANNRTNIYLYNGNISSASNFLTSVGTGSLLFGLSNFDRGGRNLNFSYPLNVKIYNKDNINIFETSINDLSLQQLFSITKTGKYKIIVKDSNGLTIKKNFEVKANFPYKLDLKLGTDFLEKNGSISTNYVVIYDKFNNPVIGDLFNINLKINGNSLAFLKNNDDELNIDTVEGFALFRLKSNNSIGNNKIQASIEMKNSDRLISFKNVKVIGGVEAKISLDKKLQVGYNTGSINFSLLNSDGTKLDISSRVYLQIDQKYGKTIKPFFDIENGEGKIIFKTAKLAGENINFQFQVEGFKTIFSKNISIFSLKPLKLQILPSKIKYEAKKDSYTTLNVELKDIYGNVVFDDNDTQIDVEILEQYNKILNSDISDVKVKKGRAKIKIYGTELPGKGFVKLGTTPSLDDNYFEVTGQGPFEKSKLISFPSMLKEGILSDLGKNFFYEFDSNNYRFKFSTKRALEESVYFSELNKNLQNKLLLLFDETNFYRVNGVGESIIELKTYFFWNKDIIKGKKYNSLYSVLLGADYGNITKKDYLASALLFDKENRSLAVTSFISSPYKYSDILFLDSNGKIKDNISPADLTQSVKFNLISGGENTYIDLYNDNLGLDIGKIVFNFDNNVNLNICDSLETCDLDIENTSINGINKYGNYSYKINSEENLLVLENEYSDKILSVTGSGKINLYENISLELSKDNSEFLLFDVKKSGDIIAQLGFNFNNSKIKITRNDIIFKGLLKTLKNSIIIKLNSDNYGTRKIYSKKGVNTISIYYNDPFLRENTLNSFAKGNLGLFDNFVNLGGVGWKGNNKSLLAFAAGKSVGEAIKDNQSVLLINLGDPVVSLKKKKIKKPKIDGYKKFDRTIGKKINKFDIEGYRVFDYNNDQKEDILFIKNDNYLSLLENQDIHGNFINLRNLARIEDIGNLELIKTGDFTGDGYDDIFFVNNKGEPAILNNKIKDFVRIDLKEQFKLSAGIMSAESFDMDNDGIDDIVILDEKGAVYIFYGTNTNSKNPLFVKKNIYSGYGIKLNSSIRNDYGLIFYEGVPQLSNKEDNLKALQSSEEMNKIIDENLEEIRKNAKEIKHDQIPDPRVLENLKNSENNISESQIDSGFNDGMLSSFVFKNVAYFNNSDPKNSIDLGDKDGLLYNTKKEAKESLTSFFNENLENITSIEANPTKQLTFIRSQYSEKLGVKVEKKYIDRNKGNLLSGDIVNVKVKLKNITSHNINNIVYIENFSKIFELVEDSVTNNKNLEWSVPQDFGNILIDSINLGPGEIFELNYNLKTRKLKIGYIKVGLFEKGEIGDDLYGDIIYKNNDKNCGNTVDIFRSIGSRIYKKGKKTPIKDEPIELPDELDNPDDDENGIPDYLDELLEKVKTVKDTKSDDGIHFDSDYLTGKLDKIYDDGIGFDSLQPESGGEDVMSSLDRFNDKIDDINDGIDKIVEGLGCGFGGGSCLDLPINWAPLAVGSDPVVFGYPVGDGLNISEGLPIFSALTGLQTMCGPSACCLPTVWPMSSMAFVPGTTCGDNSAGGRFGTWSPNNFFRLFYSPTLTGGQGIALCFGGPADVYGNEQPAGVSPVVPGGNCIVAAAPLWACNKDDEDLGDPMTMGEVSYVSGSGTGNDFGTINGNCSSLDNSKVNSDTANLDSNLVEEYLNYKKTGNLSDSLVNNFKESFGNPYNEDGEIGGLPVGLNGTPLISIDGGNDGLMSADVDLDLSAIGKGDFENIIKVKNVRISPFPDFLMDWVTRQIEEIVTKLTDFPTIYIIFPDLSGIFDEDWGKYVSEGTKKLSEDSKSGKDKGLNKQLSGIGQIYEFLSNLPIVNIYSEDVEINIPWIDQYVLEKTISDYKNTMGQRKRELDRFSNECTDESLKNKITLDITKTINSLEKNIEVLEERKQIPDKLFDLVNKKEDRLEQILCNIETISDILGGWIGKNGERFKAWVELYVLIKAILKSRQLLVDLFNDYDAECHECKNERSDLLYFVLKLISMIIPKIPVVQFPKWPDLIIDFHNIRLSIDISLPNLILNKRPIVLPTLPDLVLPNIPNLRIKTPEIPILPSLDIPELPDLPLLPKINLPNLPPPPKLPKLFSAIEAVLKILKLVAKILCILEKSPLVPEWRAGDQITFLTERTGYLPLDFLNISFPQFSLSFVDAIKISTWVNFEEDIDFITEMVRNVAGPINSFTNDITHLFDFNFEVLDYGDALPGDVDIGVDKVGYNESLNKLVLSMSVGILKIVNILNNEKNINISNKDFIQLVNNSLNKKEYINDSRVDELRKTWHSMENISFSNQNKIIKEALDNNYKKFELLKKVINNERYKNQKLKDIIKNKNFKSYTKISKDFNNDYSSYNKLFSKYNNKVRLKAKQLLEYDGKDIRKLKEEGNNLLTRIKGGLNSYKLSSSGINKKLLVKTNGTSKSTASDKNNPLKKGINYKYEGIYVSEKGGSYKLFDYIDNLTGKEKTTAIDADNDGDKDLLYLVDNELFLKENLSVKDSKNFVTLSPLSVDSDDNKFFDRDFIEAINLYDEVGVSSDRINFSFLASTDDKINNYRVEFYDRIDKLYRSNDENYFPKGLQKSVVDMFSNTEQIGETEVSTGYTISKNIAYLDYVGIIPGVKLRTNELVDITGTIREGIISTISANTKLYTSDSNVNIYYIDENDKKQEIEVSKYSNIYFTNPINIYQVEGGSLYVDTGFKKTLIGQNISEYMKKPLLFGTEIFVEDNIKLKESAHIDIKYYEGSEYNLDLRKVKYYTIYDLGANKSRLNSVSLFHENDYYYSKIYTFYGNIYGTVSRQVLLAPQVEADDIFPELNLDDIRIPVYQKKIIDLTDLIYEDSGIDNLDIRIENLNPPNYNIIKKSGHISVEFGKFDYIFKTKIKFILTDKNGNITKKDVGFEVYPPKPEISNYGSGIISGYLDENLNNEPINIYRFRGGKFSRLETFSGSTKVNTSSGKFDFTVNLTGNLDIQDLELKDSYGNIGIIKGDKGVLDVSRLGYNIELKIEDEYPILYIKDNNNIEIYRQKIIFNNIKNITPISSFENIISPAGKEGLYLKLLDEKYDYFINPLELKLSSGELFIYRKSDINKKPLFIIFKDGRIKPLNLYYKIEYSEYKGYIVYKLIDKHFNRVIAELLLKINNNFIIK